MRTGADSYEGYKEELLNRFDRSIERTLRALKQDRTSPVSSDESQSQGPEMNLSNMPKCFRGTFAAGSGQTIQGKTCKPQRSFFEPKVSDRSQGIHHYGGKPEPAQELSVGFDEEFLRQQYERKYLDPKTPSDPVASPQHSDTIKIGQALKWSKSNTKQNTVVRHSSSKEHLQENPQYKSSTEHKSLLSENSELRVQVLHIQSQLDEEKAKTRNLEREFQKLYALLEAQHLQPVLKVEPPPVVVSQSNNPSKATQTTPTRKVSVSSGGRRSWSGDEGDLGVSGVSRSAILKKKRKKIEQVHEGTADSKQMTNKRVQKVKRKDVTSSKTSGAQHSDLRGKGPKLDLRKASNSARKRRESRSESDLTKQSKQNRIIKTPAQSYKVPRPCRFLTEAIESR